MPVSSGKYKYLSGAICKIFQKNSYFLHKTFDGMKKNTEIWALNKK